MKTTKTTTRSTTKRVSNGSASDVAVGMITGGAFLAPGMASKLQYDVPNAILGALFLAAGTATLIFVAARGIDALRLIL